MSCDYKEEAIKKIAKTRKEELIIEQLPDLLFHFLSMNEVYLRWYIVEVSKAWSFQYVTHYPTQHGLSDILHRATGVSEHHHIVREWRAFLKEWNSI